MLEEWRSGDGIEVLDGWTFQVYYFIPDASKIELFMSRSFVQFSSESVCLIPCNDP
jgi:hypothetical protein